LVGQREERLRSNFQSRYTQKSSECSFKPLYGKLKHL
jgi:hypothetical protein